MDGTAGVPLPPEARRLNGWHGPGCFGCAADGPAGVGMNVHQVGDAVVGDVVFGAVHAAAHGAVHGGLVATVCDDLLSYLLVVHTELAVTRTLEVGYLRPVHVGRPYRLMARMAERTGRRLHMTASGTTTDGIVSFTAEAVFVRVDPAHFDQPGVRLDPRLLGWQVSDTPDPSSEGSGDTAEESSPSSPPR